MAVTVKCGNQSTLNPGKTCQRPSQHYGLHRDRATAPRKFDVSSTVTQWGDNEGRPAA